VIEEIINKLPSNSETIDDLQKVLPYLFNTKYHNCSTKQVELGYGLKLLKHTFYGGYTTYYWEAITFGNYVLKARTTLSMKNTIVAKKLLQYLKNQFKCQDGELIYDQLYQTNISLYTKDSIELFIQPVQIDSRRTQALHYFTNILSDYDYTPFHINYGIHAAFDHIRYFIANNDTEGLEKILFSPNAAGRLFAARTLIYMRETKSYVPSSKITKRIDDAILSSHKISTGMISCHIGKFDYDYFDIVENFESYLINN